MLIFVIFNIAFSFFNADKITVVLKVTAILVIGRGGGLVQTCISQPNNVALTKNYALENVAAYYQLFQNWEIIEKTIIWQFNHTIIVTTLEYNTIL